MANIIVLSLFVILIAKGLSNPRFVLYTVVFLAPWMGLDMDIGLRITAYRVALAALVVVLFLLLANRRNKISFIIIKPNPWFWVFIFYAVCLSLLQIIWLQTIEVEGGALRSGQMRSIFQIIMFGLTISPILLIPYLVHKQEYIFQCGKIYLWSVTILAVLGFIQLFIWYVTGKNPFPIGYVNSLLTASSPEMLRSGIDFVGGSTVYRMNSFGGEPKGLATGLAIGLLILQVSYSGDILPIKQKRKMIWLWGFLMTALILTWSTSGGFLWLIGTLTVTFIGLGKSAKKYGRKSVIVSLLLVIFVIGGGYTVMMLDESGGGIYSSVATNRFIERNPIEDFDRTVLDFLSDNPEHIALGVGLGNVHHYAANYIPSLSEHYMVGNVFSAKSGYLRVISELGMVGLILLILTVWWLLSRIQRKSSALGRVASHLNIGYVVYALGLVLFVGGMARTYIWPQMFVMLGLCASYIQLSFPLQRDNYQKTNYRLSLAHRMKTK